MLVTVTQQDIANGKRGSPTHCPVGLAVQAAYVGRIKGVFVTKDNIQLICPYGALWFKAPKEWLIEFDSGKLCLPLTFEMKIDESIPNPLPPKVILPGRIY